MQPACSNTHSDSGRHAISIACPNPNTCTHFESHLYSDLCPGPDCYPHAGTDSDLETHTSTYSHSGPYRYASAAYTSPDIRENIPVFGVHPDPSQQWKWSASRGWLCRDERTCRLAI